MSRKPYPSDLTRVCGGTRPYAMNSISLLGLSPRVRGNRSRNPADAPPTRSIPACAGEPKYDDAQHGYQGVYPRMCGGTFWRETRGDLRGGLSPRVRGNLHGQPFQAVGWRSIPACAGDPLTALMTTPTCRVYPRVCGGTAYRSSTYPTWRGIDPGRPTISCSSARFPRTRGDRPLSTRSLNGQVSVPPHTRG